MGQYLPRQQTWGSDLDGRVRPPSANLLHNEPAPPRFLTVSSADAGARTFTPLRVAYLVGGAFAMALSYQKNASILWAFLHGFVWAPYLAYRLVTKGSKSRKNPRRHSRRRR